MINSSLVAPPFLSSPTKKTKPHWVLRFFDNAYATGLLVFLIYILFYSATNFAEHPIEYCLLLVNGLLSIYGQLLSIKKEASLHFISFFFCFLFMSIAPIAQIGLSHDPVFDMEYIPLIACFSALLFTVIGLFFTKRLRPDQDEQSVPGNGNYGLLFIVTFLVGAVSLYLFKDALFTSRQGFGHLIGKLFSDQASATLATNFLLSVPFFGGAIGLRAARANRRRSWEIMFLFLLIIGALLNNPFINPRFKLAGLLFFFLDYMNRGKKLRLMVLFLVIGALSCLL